MNNQYIDKILDSLDPTMLALFDRGDIIDFLLLTFTDEELYDIINNVDLELAKEIEKLVTSNVFPKYLKPLFEYMKDKILRVTSSVDIYTIQELFLKYFPNVIDLHINDGYPGDVLYLTISKEGVKSLKETIDLPRIYFYYDTSYGLNMDWITDESEIDDLVNSYITIDEEDGSDYQTIFNRWQEAGRNIISYQSFAREAMLAKIERNKIQQETKNLKEDQDNG